MARGIARWRELGGLFEEARRICRCAPRPSRPSRELDGQSDLVVRLDRRERQVVAAFLDGDRSGRQARMGLAPDMLRHARMDR